MGVQEHDDCRADWLHSHRRSVCKNTVVLVLRVVPAVCRVTCCLISARYCLLLAELTGGIVRCMGSDLTGHLALAMGPELTASIVHCAGIKNIGKLVAQVSRRLLWVYSRVRWLLWVYRAFRVQVA